MRLAFLRPWRKLQHREVGKAGLHIVGSGIRALLEMRAETLENALK